ncbi:MAG: ADP-ribosylglycohydrolase family protein [Pseudomonadota bacterium]
MSQSQPASGSFADRAHGALLGLAVGDALGTTLEFTQRDSTPHHTEMIGGGPFRLEPGVWTDDTSMALCLAENLLAAGEVAPRDLMGRFIGWWRRGRNSVTGSCFDIGNTTRAALERFERTDNPLAGDTSAPAAGNGSLMRLAPVALFYCDDRAAAGRAARLQSRTTHATPECLDACEAFALLLVDALQGAEKDSVLADQITGFSGQVGEIMAGRWRGKPRDGISSSGYVAHTLEAALWAVSQASSFEEAIVLAINLGDDADTVGAVTGQLAGALWGASAIPPRWLEQLAWRDRLEATARALLQKSAEGRGLAAFLQPHDGPEDSPGWLHQVAQGRWDAVPADLAYDDSVVFAHLLNGYAMAERLGFEHASKVAHAALAIYRDTGAWSGSAVELWITLFFQHRADRFTVMLDAPEPQPHLDELCRAVRRQLVAGVIWPEGMAA